MKKKIYKVKVDFSKIYSFFQRNKSFFFLLFACLYVPLVFGIGYIAITKEYHFILYNILIGLFIFSVYETIFSKSIHYKNNEK